MVSESDVHYGHSVSSAKSMDVLGLELDPDSGEVMDLLREKYMKFFEDMSFDPIANDWPGLDDIEKVKVALCNVRSSNNFSTPMDEELLTGCCGYPCMIMRYRSFQDKVKVAHASALMVSIDDKANRSRTTGDHDHFLEDLTKFHVRAFNPEGYEKLYPDRGTLHPFLEELITYLRTDLNPCFTQPRHQNILIKGALDFIEACQLENDYDDKSVFEVTDDMVNFPEFVRVKSGLGEFFAVFQMTAPELVPGGYLSSHSNDDQQFFYRYLYPMLAEIMEAARLLNDYLSFYKEAKDSEMTSFIFIYAKQKHILPLEAMDEIASLIVANRKRVVKLGERSGSSVVKQAGVEFISGTIAWHVWWNKRYKLREIISHGPQSP